ncbi:unnamed protein product [Durusdinium trenchii]|uniref:SMP-30/Gluconolactonase/LRE-like region domain-containing protein n=1 Tax=Durusdinium trenchii TaxID=1381693 RepID=A0ABP0SX03_9DINO
MPSVQVRALSGRVLWGPKDLDITISCAKLKEDVLTSLGERFPAPVQLLVEDMLLPEHGRLETVLPFEKYPQMAIELTLVVKPQAHKPSEPLPGLYVSELNNHRVTRWLNASAEIVMGGFGRGSERSQLAGPRSIVSGANGAIYIAEIGNQRVSEWSLQGRGLAQYVKTIAENTPACSLEEPGAICVDNDGQLYVADSKAHAVSCWIEENTRIEGRIVAGGKGPGDDLDQLNRPTGVAIDDDGTLYIAEFGNDRVTRWAPGAKMGEVVAGGNGWGDDLDQLAGPVALSLQGSSKPRTKKPHDTAFAILVCELGNNRISRWWPGERRCEVLVGHGTLPELMGPQEIFYNDEDGSIFVSAVVVFAVMIC